MSDFESYAAGREARRSAPHRAWRPDEAHRQDALQRYLRAVASAAPTGEAEETTAGARAGAPAAPEQPDGTAPDGPKPEPAVVRDVMTVPAVSVPRELPYLDIVKTLSREHLSALPVVDEEDRVLGVVSESDLLAKAAVESTGRRKPPIGRRREHKLFDKSRGETAGTLMTSPAVTVHPGTPVAEAAWTAARARVKRLPVTDRLGRLVGVVSRRDLLRALVREDAMIRDEIESRILRQEFGLTPGMVRVAVDHGLVTLEGDLGPDIAERLVEEVRDIDDVVDVIDRLGSPRPA